MEAPHLLSNTFTTTAAHHNFVGGFMYIPLTSITVNLTAVPQGGWGNFFPFHPIPENLTTIYILLFYLYTVHIQHNLLMVSTVPNRIPQN